MIFHIADNFKFFILKGYIFLKKIIRAIVQGDLKLAI